MRASKTAPDPWFELPSPVAKTRRPPARPAMPAPAPAPAPAGRWLAPPRRRDPIDLAFALTWGLLTLPFRVVFGVVRLVGQVTGVVVGFALMVAGAAISAGPLAILGIPLFVVGLLVAMRSLG